MKIGYIADCHVGNHKICGGSFELAMNDRCRGIIDVLERTVQYASERCERIIVLGDLFDTENPPPQMIAAVGHAFAFNETGVLVGNHDQVSGKLGDHALGWLDCAEKMQVYEVPECVGFAESSAMFMVPFQAGDPKEWLTSAVVDLACCTAIHQTRTLCIHLGLRDAKARENPWAAKAVDAVDVEWLAELCKTHRITHVFAGNWHHYQQWEIDGVLMTQCGALVPTGWDNPGLEGYGGLIIFDTETGEVVRHEIPGPRFVTVSSEAELFVLPLELDLYVRWTCKPDEVDQAWFLLAEHAYGHGDVVVDTTELKAGAQRAARAATDQATVCDALDGYIAELTMPEGVSPDRVGQLCTGFLDLSGEVV